METTPIDRIVMRTKLELFDQHISTLVFGHFCADKITYPIDTLAAAPTIIHCLNRELDCEKVALMIYLALKHPEIIPSYGDSYCWEIANDINQAIKQFQSEKPRKPAGLYVIHCLSTNHGPIHVASTTNRDFVLFLSTQTIHDQDNKRNSTTKSLWAEQDHAAKTYRQQRHEKLKQVQEKRQKLDRLVFFLGRPQYRDFLLRRFGDDYAPYQHTLRVLQRLQSGSLSVRQAAWQLFDDPAFYREGFLTLQNARYRKLIDFIYQNPSLHFDPSDMTDGLQTAREWLAAKKFSPNLRRVYGKQLVRLFCDYRVRDAIEAAAQNS